jgi:hypothetical protein
MSVVSSVNWVNVTVVSDLVISTVLFLNILRVSHSKLQRIWITLAIILEFAVLAKFWIPLDASSPTNLLDLIFFFVAYDLVTALATLSSITRSWAIIQELDLLDFTPSPRAVIGTTLMLLLTGTFLSTSLVYGAPSLLIGYCCYAGLLWKITRFLSQRNLTGTPSPSAIILRRTFNAMVVIIVILVLFFLSAVTDQASKYFDADNDWMYIIQVKDSDATTFNRLQIALIYLSLKKVVTIIGTGYWFIDKRRPHNDSFGADVGFGNYDY